MVGAGALIRPLLGLQHEYAHAIGVLIVGFIVVFIVVTAGMVSTTWVQFIKGSLLVVFCLLLTVMILARGLQVNPAASQVAGGTPTTAAEAAKFPIATIRSLPNGEQKTGPVGPLEYIATLQKSELVFWTKRAVEKDYVPTAATGGDVLVPGASPTFKGVRSERLVDKLDFLSLMIALFAGTASLPHILIRYYTVKDGDAARKSTVVGIASIGFFYILTLFLGLGAMTSLPPTTDSNMAAPLLARQFGEFWFAVISAIAFTTVLGTVSGLIIAASGAVAHDLMTNYLRMDLDDHGKVRAAKIASVVVGVIAMALGILFKDFNASFLVGWAFNVAASANLPALVMLLFWDRTTKQGITAAIVVGLLSSLGWLALTGPAYQNVYGLDPARAPMPFSQPAIVTIPLGFAVLIVVSLMTRQSRVGGSGAGFEVTAPARAGR